MARTMTLDSCDPLEIFPPELTQQLFDLLPIEDTWRLRSISRRWHTYLTDTGVRAAINRWHTQFSSPGSLEVGCLKLDLRSYERRIVSLLSGRPQAHTTINVNCVVDSLLNTELQGKWLAYRTNHELNGPMHIDVWNLTTQQKTSIVTGDAELPGFILSDNMLAYTINDPALGQPVWKDRVIDNVLVTHRLDDVLIKREFPLFHGEQMQQGTDIAIDGSYIIVYRRRGEQEYNERIDVFDTVTGENWSFNLTIPVQDTMSYTFRIDSTTKTVNLWTAYTKYKMGSLPGLDNMIMRCMVTVYDYTFNGDLLQKRDMEIMLNDEDKEDNVIFGPWIMDLSLAGRPGYWSALINFAFGSDQDTTMAIDCNSGSDKVDAYYRSKRAARLWKNMVFQCDADGVLHIGRRRNAQTMDTHAVSKIDLTRVLGQLAEATWGHTGMVGVNDHFLAMASKRTIWVCSFDQRAEQDAVQIPLSTPGDDKTTILTWTTAQDLVTAETGEFAALKRYNPDATTEPRARPALSEDYAILNTLQRTLDMLNEPI